MDERAPSLRELQNWMSWVVTHSRGVADALETREAEPSPRCFAAIADRPPLPKVERLDVYAEAYFERLVECLEDDFPAVRRVLGEELFRDLVSAFLDEHPSRSFTASTLGAPLPRFLADYELSEQLPYLPDLAKFEWAQVEAFFAPETVPLDTTRLAAIGEADWPNVVLKLDASVRLLESQWNIDDVAASDEQPAEQSSRSLLVWREGTGVNFKVRTERLDELQAIALEQMRQGRTLGQICDALEVRLDVDAELPPLMDWFREWVSRGVIADVRVRRAR